MKKSDLKDGMIVEYRNGLRRLVLGDKLLGEHGNANIEEYDEELKYIDGESTLDIVKVYTVESSLCVAIGSIFLNKHLNLIWERVKEIDWAKVPFGTKVIVTDHKEELNEDCGEYVMFVGYNPKLETYPFIVTHSEKDYVSSYAYCMIDPEQEIKEDWYK
ncbi:hypothetical protein [Clostridium perfringens]|uniref:hypothetical protein n=1 Tax=Clostridium perfringens TaxID=1502 RepID=UPI0032D9B179